MAEINSPVQSQTLGLVEQSQNFALTPLKQNPIDAKLTKLSVHSFKEMQTTLSEIAGTPVSFFSGNSSLQAKCYLLSLLTKSLVKENQYFKAELTSETKVDAPANTSYEITEFSQKLSQLPMAKILTAASAKVIDGSLCAQDGALLLKSGQNQMRIFNDWGNNVAKLVQTYQSLLPDVPTTEKEVMSVKLDEAKGALAAIKQMTGRVGDGVKSLESAIVDKFGRTALDLPIVAEHSSKNPGVVYQLHRLNQ